MDSTFMSNCENHKKEVAGISDMKVLAKAVYGWLTQWIRVSEIGILLELLAK